MTTRKVKLTTRLKHLEKQLTPGRRRRIYRLASVVVLAVAAHKLDHGDVLQALATILGVAPAELAARNTK